MADRTLIRPSIAIRLAAPLLVAASIAACGGQVSSHGNRPDPEFLSQIRPGAQNKAQVQALLGSPSSVAPFDNDTWLYVSQKSEQTWFLPRDTVDRQVVRIRFDESGQVASVEELALEDGEDVSLVERTTPTRGENLTFIDQMWQALIGGPVGGGILGGDVDASSLPR